MTLSIPRLETERLILREWRESDLDGLCEFHADPVSVAVYHENPSRHDVWRRIAMRIGHWMLRGFGPWALEDKVTGAFVGACSLYYPEGWGDVELGYGIHPKFRGRGLAVEAAKRAREHGYSHHGFKRLVSYVSADNANSNRVAQKLGATPDGIFTISNMPHTIYLHPKPEFQSPL
jgi:RimJ/RimL family protein N-acetyltransferase